MKRRFGMMLALMITAGSILTACGSEGTNQNANASDSAQAGPEVTPPSTLITEGKITYAINANFPPYEYMDDNQEITGFDVEYMQAMADLMGLEVEMVDMQWDNLITSLQAGRVDIVNSAVYVNDERKEVVDFVPYMYIGETILVKGDSEYDFSDIEGLSGLSIGVIVGSIEETYCTQFNEQFAAEGKELIDVHSLPSLNDSLVSVASGQLDATLTSSATAAYLAVEQPGTYKAIGAFALDTELGICVAKGDTEMAEALTQCAQILHENGTYAELMKKYGLQEELDYFK